MSPTNTNENWKTETRVTDEQVASYNENGYLKFGRIFTQAELDELRDYVDDMIAALPADKRPEQMDVPHFEHPYLFKYLADPRVLDVIERFIGPDILLWSSHFISKRTSDGLAVPWHQDGVYWGDRLQPMRVITMWLAVDESMVENGCMRVIAGSHKLKDRRYEKVDREKHLFGREVIAEDMDPSKVVDSGFSGRRMPLPRCVHHPRLRPKHLAKASMRLYDALYASKRPLPRLVVEARAITSISYAVKIGRTVSTPTHPCQIFPEI